MNGLILQGFEWYLENNGKHYNFIKDNLDYFKEMGFTAIWLPPVTKGTSSNDVGYGIYDLYDLGEFDQKGTVRTKYGTKEELLSLIEEAHKRDICIYADFVLNHKAGADETEIFKAVKVDPNNRLEQLGEPRDIEGWTKFTFPGRKDKYSKFKWRFQHFKGVDYDEKTKETAIFKILWEDRDWSYSVSGEHGNYDYLMYADIDHFNEDVKNELFNWVKWFVKETNIDGIRYDAIKHIDTNFIDEFTKFILKEIDEKFYFVGEYWENDINKLIEIIDSTSSNIDLFDVTYHYKFYEASKSGKDFDLTTLFDNSIESKRSSNSVTFVDNHDSQLGQSLESWVEEWFRQSAYALILLRENGYPCVFWGDLFGIGDKSEFKGIKEQLEVIFKIRKKYAYGRQENYSNNKNSIGFVRYGNKKNLNKLAVTIGNDYENIHEVRMFIGESERGKVFIDKLGNSDVEVTIEEDGYANFLTPGLGVSVWLEKKLTI